MNVGEATLVSTVDDGALAPSAKRSRRNAILGSAIGYATDGFDLLILGFMLRPISADLGLTQAQGASLITATLLGAVLGGFGFGCHLLALSSALHGSCERERHEHRPHRGLDDGPGVQPLEPQLGRLRQLERRLVSSLEEQ